MTQKYVTSTPYKYTSNTECDEILSMSAAWGSTFMIVCKNGVYAYGTHNNAFIG